VSKLGNENQLALRFFSTYQEYLFQSGILASQEAEIRRIEVQTQPGQMVCETLSRKILHQKGLAEWLKV
jgi:hypothetical protein